MTLQKTDANHADLTVRVVVPYRLDLTVNALRRLPENVVDVVTPDDWYARAFDGPDGIDIVEAKQVAPDRLNIRISGENPQARLQGAIWMLGTDIDLQPWYERVKAFPWLSELSSQLLGLKPPRYPDIWEALCHGIIFQQISIAAAASIMKRLVTHFSTPIDHRGVQLYPFPRPETIATASDSAFAAIGLSRMKTTYIRGAAIAVLDGSVTKTRIGNLATPDACAELMLLHGIGPWSASNIMLRGFGRLDTFPMKDTGVAASIGLLSGGKQTDVNTLLNELGDLRGLLYFHLLLGARAMRARMR